MDTKAKRLRREGYVTGNVFGREMEGSLPVKIEKSAVEKLLKTNNKGSQIMLDVDGQSYDVLIKEIQFNPLKGQVDEIDFQALVSNEKVHSVADRTCKPRQTGSRCITAASGRNLLQSSPISTGRQSYGRCR